MDSHSFSSGAANHHKYYEEDDDDDDDEMDWEDEADVPQYSDDDYSSSEDLPYQYDPRSHGRSGGMRSGHGQRTHSGPGQQSRSLHGAFSSYSASDHPDANPTIERLKMEMAGLRRQSQDAVNASLRLSDQLAAAQEEAAHAKSALKVSENMLEDETRRRIQAEKAADDEARRRRSAEDALRQHRAQMAQARRDSKQYSQA